MTIISPPLSYPLASLAFAYINILFFRWDSTDSAPSVNVKIKANPFSAVSRLKLTAAKEIYASAGVWDSVNPWAVFCTSTGYILRTNVGTGDAAPTKQNFQNFPAVSVAFVLP